MMTGEIGHLCLWLALGTALVQMSLPLNGARLGDARLVALAVPATLMQAVLVSLSYGALTYAFIRSDFSLLAVAANSHTAKPMLYKVTGVWGNHEGSLLLWVLILSLSGAAVALFGRRLPADFRARALAVQGAIGVGFYLFLLLTSNPFARIVPTPAEGQGLNPILQDPGLAFHPPMLYCGYVGLSIAFSFAIAALIEGRIGPLWARWVRPWTLAAWAALTVGIALGSWWAYYELGWGGYWFWDPVENASLMPWLAATALLHSVIVLEKRDALKSWTVLLAIVAFSLSLMGTFIVRSGVLSSIHAFASDPERGLFILTFLLIVVGGALTLFAWRANSLEVSSSFTTISREGFLVGNNLLLMALLATVFLGTLYPLVLETITGTQISVGAPYYRLTFAPLLALVILLAGLGPFYHWRRDQLTRPRLRLLITLSITAILFGLIWVFARRTSFMTLLGLAGSFWLIGSIGADIAHRLRYGDGGLRTTAVRLWRLPASVYAMALGHIGLAVTILGITCSGAWQQEQLTTMHVGETIHVGPFAYHLRTISPIAGKNYTALEATFAVTRNGNPVTILHPEVRAYFDPPQETTEAGIHSLWNGDLYAVLGKEVTANSWQVRLHWKPFVTLIWLGGLIMALGGMTAILDRRRLAWRTVSA